MIELDNLDKIFMLQYESQKARGFNNLLNGDFEEEALLLKMEWQQYVNLMALALVDETMEMLEETSFKNPAYVFAGWKRQQATDLAKMQQEVIDMWCFMINISLAAGFTSRQLFDEFERKHLENMQRHLGDY